MDTSPRTKLEGPQLTPGEERRRSQRVVIRIPVKVHFMLGSKADTLAAKTAAVNDHGALLICPRVFPVDTRLEVELEGSGRRQAGHVLRVPRITALGFEVPVEFDKVIPGFWGIAFPPSDWQAAP